MAPTNEPEIHVIKFLAEAGAARRAEQERQRSEARQRYLDHLTSALPGVDRLASPAERAGAVLDVLTDWRDVGSGDRCQCSCHPALPTTDLHDYGFACTCRQSAEEREQHRTAWQAEMDAFWSSPEGEQVTARHESEEQELDQWLASNPGVVVRSHGGYAPEQWWGSVDSRPFYFRERHDQWRIELDLRPSGRFSTVWVGGDWEDESSFEQREIEVGEIIAEGTTAVDGYGAGPSERLAFIVGVIRDHVGRQSCSVHTSDRAATEAALGRSMKWCPECGTDIR